MADVALGFLLQNLTTMLSGEIKLVRGFKDAMSKLQKSLTRAQEFLSDAEEKEIRDRSVRDWLKDLEDVAFQADDVLDEFNYHLQNKLNHQKQGPKKVLCFSSSSGSTSLFFRRKMAQKINDLNTKFNNLNKEAESKGLVQMVVTAPDASTVGLDETNSYSIESYVVGRESDVEEIVEMVLNAPLEEKISILPIVGMGGLGKTTLTQLIYLHEKIKSRFEKKIWICVSLNFDKLTLFRNIYSLLSEESVQLHVTTEILLQKIQKLLESKRFLMILDDVWNDDSKKWEDFLKSLLGICTATQNLIVVTTREERVALLVKTLPPYKLRSLSDDECWSIIKAKALSGIEGQLEYKDIGQQFGERCGGLPLAAQVIGGILCDLPIEDWSSILANELPNFVRDDTNHIMRILKVSYNRLPSSLLKKCFLYSSVFPQDFKIKKNTLIEQWLGEGFLQTNQENVSMEAIGNRIFNHLVQASLLQESERDILGNITHCRMHDFVHDLARSLSRGGGRGETSKDSGNDISKVRYLYLQSREPHEILKEETKHLRTLINVHGKDADNMFQGHLRVLTINDSGYQNLPVTIEKQIHMRFLDISRTEIEKLPASVNKLSNLQTLVVENLQTLPNTIIDLSNLRHLYIDQIELPPFIGKLTSLQTLPYYVVGHNRGCEIGELENLKNLKGKLKISKLERVKDKGEAGHADLFGKSGILTLVLKWTSEREGDKNDMDVLDGLQPHPNLKSLRIRGFGSIKFPSWTMKMTVHNAIQSRCEALTNLIEIKFVDCQCEEIPNLGHLPRLKFLKFENLPAVQSLGLSFYGLETPNDNANPLKITTPLFPALQELRLTGMYNLTEWVDIESRVATFPCIESLIIWLCPKLESAPTRFPCLKKLSVFEIGSNFPLVKICANTSSLQKLDIRSYSGIINIGDECFVKNPDLSHWRIKDCPNMMYIEHDSTTLHCFPSLKELYIICGSKIVPELKSMPNFDLRLLETLEISGCESLVDLPKWTNLPQLRSLSIGRFSQLIDADSFNDFLKRILHTSHRLEDLTIYGNEEWVSLPDHIQHFHALQHLLVEDYGIEVLPEWIGNLSSLQSLIIGNCKRLHHLPSRETMQRLTKLSEVWIDQCPLLTEKIRTQQETTPDDADNSEWSKISHVKNVYVDYGSYHQNSTPKAPPVQDKNKFAGCFPIPRNRKN